MELGLKGKRVAILAGDDVESRELAEPKQALDTAGATTKVVSPQGGQLRAKNGDQIAVDCTLDACKASDFDALLLPGGRGATALAKDAGAVQLVREFMLADKPVAAICHGVALLVAADAVAGRSVTSAPDLQAKVAASGGDWVDVPVKVDDRLITSRGPNDLPHFTKALVKEFANRLEESKVDQLSEQSFRQVIHRRDHRRSEEQGPPRHAPESPGHTGHESPL